MTTKKPPQPRANHVAAIISKFGGMQRCAQICDISDSCVHHWVKAVPPEHLWRLLSYARQHDMDIPLRDFRPDLEFKPIKKASRAHL